MLLATGDSHKFVGDMEDSSEDEGLTEEAKGQPSLILMYLVHCMCMFNEG